MLARDWTCQPVKVKSGSNPNGSFDSFCGADCVCFDPPLTVTVILVLALRALPLRSVAVIVKLTSPAETELPS